ncbi:hypothetical protein M0R19_00745 [Candidatus Pacearchaeota archaeon]|nr:hypothetical protein [Candidatus Pacearchaeota archaeon]
MEKIYELEFKTQIGPNSHIHKIYLQGKKVLGYTTFSPFIIENVTIKEIDERNVPKNIADKIKN